MKSFLYTCLLLPLSVASATALWLSPLPNSANRTLSSVQVLTDRLDPVVGAVVRLETGAEDLTTVTDTDGQTPWFELDPTAGVIITMAERNTAGGICLGMLEDTIAPFQLLPGTDSLSIQISRTQPLAVPVQIEADPQFSNQILPPDGDYPHWTIITTAGAVRFEAHVASLLDAESLQGFTAYHGHPLDPTVGYVRGVDLVMPAVQLGSGGIGVGFSLLGALPAGGSVDAYILTDLPPLIPVGPPFALSDISIHNDMIYVRLSGGVPKGHLLLVARPDDGSPPRISILQDDTPSFSIPVDAGGGVQVVRTIDEGREEPPPAASFLGIALQPHGMIVDSACEPPVPNPNFTPCTPPALDSPGGCGPGVPAGPVECNDKDPIKSRSEKICKGPGHGHNRTRARTVKWKVSFKLTTFDGSPIAAEGGFSYGEESQEVSVDSWTAQPGAYGLGQCIRYYRFDLICGQAYTLKVDDVEMDGFPPMFTSVPCTKDKIAYSSCHDAVEIDSTCDRTP